MFTNRCLLPALFGVVVTDWFISRVDCACACVAVATSTPEM